MKKVISHLKEHQDNYLWLLLGLMSLVALLQVNTNSVLTWSIIAGLLYLLYRSTKKNGGK